MIRLLPGTPFPKSTVAAVILRAASICILILCLLTGLAQANPPPLFQDFYNVSIGQYQVLSQGGRSIGNDSNWFMNQMLTQYSKFFANWQAKQRARVVIFSNLDDFRAYAATTTGQTHTTLAGFCHLATDTDGNRFFELVTYQHNSLWRVLAHEGFHQFIYYELGPGTPIWLNEGLAQYFETSYVLRGRLVTGDIQKQMLQHVQNLIRAGRAPSIADLIRLDKPAFYADSQRCYPTAWALAYFLLHRDNTRYADSDMKRYFQDIKLGKDPVASFANRFGRDAKALQAEFDRYVLNLKARFD